ncbi:MAG: PAS domain S-box protein [Chloroflexia bacterium]
MRPSFSASWLRPGDMHPALGYVLAVGLVGLVLLIQLSLGPLAYKIPFLLFHVAVAGGAWFGGIGPGLLATALSASAATYYFLPPYHSPNLADSDVLASVSLFVLVALLINGLSYARRQADGSIYAERAKLQATLSSIGDAALATDTDGNVTFINTVAQSLTGWTQQEALGKPIEQVLNIVREGGRTPAPNPVRRVLSEGAIVGLANHTLLIARDGTERPIDDSATPIHDHKGRLVGVVMVFRDISERREAERAKATLLEQVEHERQRLDDLVASVPGVVWEAWGKPDEATQSINFVSRHVEKMLGYTREEWLATPNFWLTIVHPEDKEEAARHAAENFQREDGGTNRFRWVAKDGRVLWVETTDVVVRDAQGNPLGMRGVTLDLSERERLEDQVRERAESQRAMLETMVEGMPIGLALLDAEARIMSMNSEWARMTNVDLSARGKTLYDLSPTFAERRAYYEKALAGEPVDLRDVPYTIPGDDTTYYRDIHLRAVRDASGAVAGMLNAVIDVTARHELDRQKDALLALASHELKTPITTIKGYSQLALRAAGPEGNEKLRRTLITIDEQANRLTRLINEMLEVSRIQSDTLPLHHEQFDLCALVQHTVESLTPTAHDFTIELDVSATACPVFADRGRIEQVVTNLVQNAIKYSGDSRLVEVCVSREEDGSAVRVSVRDYGVGIPTDQQSQVFMRFFRARNVSATSASGLGLGLYISHEIVTRHGGRIWLESEEGRGSTFHFTLPLDQGE